MFFVVIGLCSYGLNGYSHAFNGYWPFRRVQIISLYLQAPSSLYSPLRQKGASSVMASAVSWPYIFPLVIVRLQACSRIIQVEIIQTPFFHWWTPRPGGLGGLWLWQQQETWWVDNRNKWPATYPICGNMWHCHKFGAPFVERNIKEVTNIEKQNNIYKKISGATGQQSC